jgi:hypothetical protein
MRRALGLGIGLITAGMVAGPLPRQAAALTVSVTFSGTVTSFSDDGLLDGSIGAGTPYTASLSFDAAAADTNPSTSQGDYPFAVPPWSFVLEIGSYSFAAANGFAVNVSDFPPGNGDSFQAFAEQGLDVTGSLAAPLDFSSLAFFLLGPSSGSGNVLDSDALLDVPLDLASWEGSSLSLSGGSLGLLQLFSLEASVDELTAIPEPHTGAACGLGLLLLAALRRSASARRR